MPFSKEQIETIRQMINITCSVALPQGIGGIKGARDLIALDEVCAAALAAMAETHARGQSGEPPGENTSEVVMAEVVKIDREIDAAHIAETTAALDALAAAANRAEEALKRLADCEHGGLKIKMAGSVMMCEVLPAKK